MNIHKKHCNLLDKVNHSTTEAEHTKHAEYLIAWRDGVSDAGIQFDFIECDWYYFNQDHGGPMCGGVWLDWKPEPSE